MAPRSKKIRAPSVIFFGYRKSRECSPEIFDFRANGIPVQERVDFFDALTGTELISSGIKYALKIINTFRQPVQQLRQLTDWDLQIRK